MAEYKTLLELAGEFPSIPPRKLAQEISKVIGKDESGEPLALYRVAVPTGQGLKVENTQLVKVEDKSIQFYDFAITDPDKFREWANNLSPKTKKDKFVRKSAEDAVTLALSNPDEYDRYLADLAKRKAASKPSTAEKWPAFYAGNSELIKSEDTESIQAVIDTLSKRLSGRTGYKGENRKAAIEFKNKLEQRLAELSQE